MASQLSFDLIIYPVSSQRRPGEITTDPRFPAGCGQSEHTRQTAAAEGQWSVVLQQCTQDHSSHHSPARP